MSHDILILGGGPAGLAAAIAARGRGRSALVVSTPGGESPLAKAERIDNCPGLPGISGAQLLETLEHQARSMGAEFLTGRAVSLLAWNGFQLTAGTEVASGKALVLAPGVTRQAKYPGEAQFLGRGVSYCATCDGMLYRNRAVTVVGLAPDAPEEANFLRSLGCQVTYLSPREPRGLGEDIPVIRASRFAIRGGQTVTALEADGQEIPCDAVFLLRRTVAPTDLLPALETEGGYVKVDRRMATNVPGVYAAGDCTGTPLQIAKALGEGHTAALSACTWLEQQENTLTK